MRHVSYVMSACVKYKLCSLKGQMFLSYFIFFYYCYGWWSNCQAPSSSVIHSPHLLVRATSERFLPAGGIFRASLANESHWLQSVLVLSVHWWPTPVSVGGLLSILLVIALELSQPLHKKFSGIVDQDPSNSKSNRLHVDIFRFCFIHLRYIFPYVPLKWWVVPPTSKGYFSYSTSSSITNHWFFPSNGHNHPGTFQVKVNHVKRLNIFYGQSK